MSQELNQTKICFKCGLEKKIIEFCKNTSRPGKYLTLCLDCFAEIKQTPEYREKIKKYNQTQYAKSRDKFNAQKRKHYSENFERIKENNKNYSSSLVLFNSDLFQNLINYMENDEYRRDPLKNEYGNVRCKYCGNFLTPTNDQVVKRIKSINGTGKGNSFIYCSDGCKRACPTYRQVKYPKGFKQNTSREVQPELRKMVLARDNWTCFKCDKNKEEYPELELHCHHVFPLNEDPVGSADMDNCITVCKECHNWIHKHIPGCGYTELKCT